jgi:hypothetical protein
VYLYYVNNIGNVMCVVKENNKWTGPRHPTAVSRKVPDGAHLTAQLQGTTIHIYFPFGTKLEDISHGYDELPKTP